MAVVTGMHGDVVAPPISDEETLRLWEVVDAHRQRGGLCPICRTARRCWERAGAIERLILAGRYREPRPSVSAP